MRCLGKWCVNMAAKPNELRYRNGTVQRIFFMVSDE